MSKQQHGKDFGRYNNEKNNEENSALTANELSVTG